MFRLELCKIGISEIEKLFYVFFIRDTLFLASIILGIEVVSTSLLLFGRHKKWACLQAKSANLGTMMGVFIPCLQNILGIIFYIRFSW